MCCTANSLWYCYTMRFKPNDLIIKLLHVYNQYPIPTLTNYSQDYTLYYLNLANYFRLYQAITHVNCKYLRSLSQLAGHDKLRFKSCELPEKNCKRWHNQQNTTLRNVYDQTTESDGKHGYDFQVFSKVTLKSYFPVGARKSCW